MGSINYLVFCSVLAVNQHNTTPPHPIHFLIISAIQTLTVASGNLLSPCLMPQNFILLINSFWENFRLLENFKHVELTHLPLAP